MLGYRYSSSSHRHQVIWFIDNNKNYVGISQNCEADAGPTCGNASMTHDELAM